MDPTPPTTSRSNTAGSSSNGSTTQQEPANLVLRPSSRPAPAATTTNNAAEVEADVTPRTEAVTSSSSNAQQEPSTLVRVSSSNATASEAIHGVESRAFIKSMANQWDQQDKEERRAQKRQQHNPPVVVQREPRVRNARAAKFPREKFGSQTPAAAIAGRAVAVPEVIERTQESPPEPVEAKSNPVPHIPTGRRNATSSLLAMASYGHEGSSDEERGGPSLPQGVLRAHRGWGGNELELQHAASSRGQSSTAAAVDIKQFQNFEVGVGYQGKHVVRQKTGFQTDNTAIVRDMTGGKAPAQDNPKKGKAKDGDKKKRSESMEPGVDKEGKKKRKEDPTSRLDRHLACEGLRRFRRELEDLLK